MGLWALNETQTWKKFLFNQNFDSSLNAGFGTALAECLYPDRPLFFTAGGISLSAVVFGNSGGIRISKLCRALSLSPLLSEPKKLLRPNAISQQEEQT